MVVMWLEYVMLLLLLLLYVGGTSPEIFIDLKDAHNAFWKLENTQNTSKLKLTICRIYGKKKTTSAMSGNTTKECKKRRHFKGTLKSDECRWETVAVAMATYEVTEGDHLTAVRENEFNIKLFIKTIWMTQILHVLPVCLWCFSQFVTSVFKSHWTDPLVVL